MRCPVFYAGLLIAVVSCRPEAQARPPLPACEWCGSSEAPTDLTATARIAGPDEPGERLIVTGTIFEADGRTPAAGVLLYAYQTDATGVYAMRGNETGNARRHGALRAWLRTAQDGRYRIETIRPAPYPGRSEAAHIHITLTPVGGAEGWIESIVFVDDTLLTAGQRAGSGVVQPRRDANGVLHATRDILLSEVRPGNSSSAQTTKRIEPALLAHVPARHWDVDLRQSRVEWIGTKFRGRGRHEGLVRLLDARLDPCSPAHCQGRFTLDMHNLEITDIPPSDPVPRRRLRDHLRSRDFFWTERYPVATFVLSGTNASDRADSVDALGELTLRDVTRAIRFPARITRLRDDEVHVRAELTIDRQQWGIRYRFDPIRNELVDDEISLVISLVARTQPSDANAH